MKEFIAYISQFGNFNQQQIDFISKKAKTLELHKDEYLVEAEKYLTRVSFVIEGEHNNPTFGYFYIYDCFHFCPINF